MYRVYKGIILVGQLRLSKCMYYCMGVIELFVYKLFDQACLLHVYIDIYVYTYFPPDWPPTSAPTSVYRLS